VTGIIVNGEPRDLSPAPPGLPVRGCGRDAADRRRAGHRERHLCRHRPAPAGPSAAPRSPNAQVNE